MFTLTYCLTKYGPFRTFEGAFIKLYRLLTADLDSGDGVAQMLLYEGTWIEVPNGTLPIGFNNARDEMCNRGLLVDGKLNDEMAEEFEEPDK